MSTQKQVVTLRDLVEEAKKRIVIVVICVVGLSYLMSLTSSSVWVNLPAAACLIILLRYFSFDIEMKRKAAAYNSKPSSLNAPALNKTPELPKAAPRSDWRSKVNSQVVEDAIDHFTRHLISEWVLDLWYSRLTPDKQGPEELVFIINDVLGELSRRFRNVNLIDLLTRDLIDIICRRVELFRECQAKIERQQKRSLSFEDRDSELRRVMATEDKLHPALFSPESEHKVLQHIMNSLISLTFRPEDLHCAFFHYTVRELLACCVIRPVLNLANPRFINERIEAAVMSRIKTSNRSSTAEEASPSEDLSNVSPDHFSRYLDPSVKGVELVQLKNEQHKNSKRKSATDKQHVTEFSKDPLLSMDTQSSRSWNSFPSTSKTGDVSRDPQGHRGGEGWGDVLDMMSQRKTETLAPEHLESVWAKGRNYKMKEGEKVVERVPPRWSSKELSNDEDFGENTAIARMPSQRKVINTENHLSSYSSAEEDEEQTKSNHSYTSEDEETVTGLNSPGTRVWDGRTKKNLGVSRIHHPLENSGASFKKNNKGHGRYQLARHQSGRKRSRVSGHIIDDDDSDNSEDGSLARSYSGMSATSSASYVSAAESDVTYAPKSSLLVDSFAKLRCEVLGANIVKGSSKMFAVYSIAVTDESNHSWSIKRRFRHFEELHRRLKVFPEYNLHLPPKHFLSTGVDIPVIQERCILLDEYIKKLLQLQRISGSIEVWDFLSVDSQTYAFSSSFSIIETLTVKHVSKTSTGATNMGTMTEATPGSRPWRENLSSENGKLGQHLRNNVIVDDVKSKVKTLGNDHMKTPYLDVRDSKENGGIKVGTQHADDVACAGLPTEWVPPKLTLPLLDLVDVVFQLQEGGWIRRKAFWVAKQILQLGMGDALDDWVLEKIRLLRRGTVVASGIQRVEQILWPDGIFMTKHPKRKQQSASSEEQQQEAERQAKFVHELMIEKAPAAIVSLIGQKEYDQCAEDLYFFLQSSVCLKQLAFDLLELLLLSAFPEMEQAFKQLHYEKHLFGQYTPPN
ncbi:hypothetical protein CARUB_v10008179mg [Capsella rubella]|uniref:PXA domain-containing protein n=5 Tax=Capsella TaxID=3718 RepID=R0GUT7_9BRAS|nr:uncharacterized protein LOC17899307 [Capsella rubella]EOA39561.1 hypothetical protein CARUB_v10008179mg [Capsella rubella]